jgi:hypothetical protein
VLQLRKRGLQQPAPPRARRAKAHIQRACRSDGRWPCLLIPHVCRDLDWNASAPLVLPCPNPHETDELLDQGPRKTEKQLVFFGPARFLNANSAPLFSGCRKGSFSWGDGVGTANQVVKTPISICIPNSQRQTLHLTAAAPQTPDPFRCQMRLLPVGRYTQWRYLVVVVASGSSGSTATHPSTARRLEKKRKKGGWDGNRMCHCGCGLRQLLVWEGAPHSEGLLATLRPNRPWRPSSMHPCVCVCVWGAHMPLFPPFLFLFSPSSNNNSLANSQSQRHHMAISVAGSHRK